LLAVELLAAAASAAAEPPSEWPSDELADDDVLADLAPALDLAAAPDLPGAAELPLEAAESACVLGLFACAAELELLDLAARAVGGLDAATAREKISELGCFELEGFVPVEELSVEEGRISNATCHQSIGPGVRGALVGLNLLTAVGGTHFLVLEASHHLPDGFGALGGALPSPHLAIALSADASHNLSLLPQRLFEAGEKSLVITRHGTVDAGLGADCEAVNIAVEIALQLGELRLALRHPLLAERQRLGPPSLLIVNDVLDHL
jgi:hypothetical protein